MTIDIPETRQFWPGPPFEPDHTVSCKCCGAQALVFGSVDFSRNCSEHQGVILPPSGITITYVRCSVCGLLFSPDFDHFTPEDFQALIYNDAYRQVDPDLGPGRLGTITRILEQAFGHVKTEIRLLDYGCGSGQVMAALAQQGFTQISGYDPYASPYKTVPDGPFDLILCLEVMEHIPDPGTFCARLARLCGPNGLVMVSTETQPTNIQNIGLDWWYVGPRNGHITLYTADSLNRLWQQSGLTCYHAGPGVHFACVAPPAFARHLF